ncbi:N-acyl-phosphatidylethanolamine-hydrolyzing phospholipase D-like [Paramacrobiotus metropolitanus]|uniref:N-acyl-phosphatidylethanolamine-hydrolyzing phospholipase D-like n=1 Tax=Paramacrobiotus metropolitanus TaxID=2943436 RepID=UPI0024464335|nr:N-acyl-phosphatidylethanolamine-hydrolyzing phospholipase D-like [Paramacrobiotus metropolitanus]XP_055332789.1 N-acyl-phosphatidylethanolamine-hydrolyzing phospholipase D-like [Paramacrobiotus metropolitanus]
MFGTLKFIPKNLPAVSLVFIGRELEMDRNPQDAAQSPRPKVGRFSQAVNLHYPLRENNIYKNPWETWQDHGLTTMMSFLKIAATEMHKTGVPRNIDELNKVLPVFRPDFEPNPDGRPKVTWIGHATVVLQMDGITVLTDPIFSDRCSPVQFVGNKRYRPPACGIDALPAIDAVVISHNHYDHLDLGSVRQLNARFGEKLRWYVPEGTAQWMRGNGCENVVEMNWWDENILPGTDVTFAFTPSQHWCKRTAFDYCKQLWGSWCVISPKHRFFFGGDTGYCVGFKEIGDVYGPFDISAIPIGAYEPRWFMKFAHVNPEEAVKIHIDIKSRKSLGIHWGTFILTTEYFMDPPEKLKEALEAAQLSNNDFCTVCHGKAVSSDDPANTS